MKISIFGAGNVGATCAHCLALKELADIVLLDVVEGLAEGKALDIYEASPAGRYDVRITGSSDYRLTAHSNLIIITAGLPRKPGMSRDDLLRTNSRIVADVTRSAVAQSPDAFIIVVSNPLDAMVHVAAQVSQFPKNRVMGMAGVLDTSRYRSFIAQALDVSVTDIVALKLGGHGDDMVPLPRYTTVGGIPLTELMDDQTIDKIVNRTRQGGAEIVSLLRTGSAYYAPATGIAEMAEAILKDKHRIMPCCAYCDQQYQLGGVFAGVPAILGANGIEKIIQLQLTEQEKKLFQISVDHVKQLVEKIDPQIYQPPP
jgi:malate dehydrogenase